MNKMFKLQHPADLLSRVFILEYMREIGPKALYEKANSEEKKYLFYKFLNEEDGSEEVDLNWEALLFEITLLQLEVFLSRFMDEVEQIEAERQVHYQAAREEMVREALNAPTDINIYDIAQTEMKKLDDGDNPF